MRLLVSGTYQGLGECVIGIFGHVAINVIACQKATAERVRLGEGAGRRRVGLADVGGVKNVGGAVAGDSANGSYL